MTEFSFFTMDSITSQMCGRSLWSTGWVLDRCELVLHRDVSSQRFCTLTLMLANIPRASCRTKGDSAGKMILGCRGDQIIRRGRWVRMSTGPMACHGKTGCRYIPSCPIWMKNKPNRTHSAFVVSSTPTLSLSFSISRSPPLSGCTSAFPHSLLMLSSPLATAQS